MTSVFHETMLALEKSLTVRLISNDLLKFHSDERNSHNSILNFAREKGITVVPLYIEKLQFEPPYWITDIAEIDKQNLVKIRDIKAEDLLTIESPVGDCIHLLAGRDYFLVLDKNRIVKIVSISDLNKLPIRVFLSTLLHHLEGMMAETIVSLFPRNSWLSTLSLNAQKDIQELHSIKQKDDFDTTLIDCTTMVHKFTILKKHEGTWQKFGERSKGDLQDKFKKYIKRLRNRQEHNLPPLFDDEAFENMDKIRDHIAHNNTLYRKDVKWLSDTVYLLQRWTQVLAQITNEPVNGA